MTSAAAQAPNTPRIAPGSVIPVELTKTIDAKKAKSGDPVEAKVTQDLKTNSGDVLVPKDTKERFCSYSPPTGHHIEISIWDGTRW